MRQLVLQLLWVLTILACVAERAAEKHEIRLREGPSLLRATVLGTAAPEAKAPVPDAFGRPRAPFAFLVASLDGAGSVLVGAPAGVERRLDRLRPALAPAGRVADPRLVLLCGPGDGAGLADLVRHRHEEDPPLEVLAPPASVSALVAALPGQLRSRVAVRAPERDELLRPLPGLSVRAVPLPGAADPLRLGFVFTGARRSLAVFPDLPEDLETLSPPLVGLLEGTALAFLEGGPGARFALEHPPPLRPPLRFVRLRPGDPILDPRRELARRLWALDARPAWALESLSL